MRCMTRFHKSHFSHCGPAWPTWSNLSRTDMHFKWQEITSADLGMQEYFPSFFFFFFLSLELYHSFHFSSIHVFALNPVEKEWQMRSRFEEKPEEIKYERGRKPRRISVQVMPVTESSNHITCVGSKGSH